ncbi:hypothetical protein ABL78_0127 [Leptomonas seymouri]|uniref:Uncharacterized protein n=1 Tax=Leptomonas seymouri TaxID=5684 RepID=A0A0N1PED8_LEPSE|nr:hypothetical protein ABL78_0127 [Leptomonas seymouri]|eukprot:KPI90691.1 hypothetical protein ABL78_0127 [Leptomonas seymouri]
MSVDHRATPSAAGTLQLRTSLLESVQRYNAAHADDFTSLLALLVQRTPNLTNPSWPMEECGRLCPNVELWCGSALPRDVWAPPGTPDCPFGTEPADFRIQH